jgi:hypothetical protein
MGKATAFLDIDCLGGLCLEVWERMRGVCV